MYRVQIYDSINSRSIELSNGLNSYGYQSEVVSRLSTGYDISILGDLYNFDSDNTGVCSSSMIVCVRSVSINSSIDRIKSIGSGSIYYYEYPISSYRLSSDLDRLMGMGVGVPSVLVVCEDERRLSYYRRRLSNNFINIFSSNISEGLSISSSVHCVVVDGISESSYNLVCAIRQSSQVPIVLLGDRIRNINRIRLSCVNKLLVLPKYVRVSYLEEGIRKLIGIVDQSYNIEDSISHHYTWSSMEFFINHEINRSQRSNQPLSIGIIEIDHHVQLLSDHGESMGHELIISLGELLSRILRKSDLCSRYNSSRYIILMPNTEGHRGIQLLDRIRNEWGRVVHQSLVSRFSSTLSGSVVVYNSSQTFVQYIESLFSSLSRVKLSGSNRVG